MNEEKIKIDFKEFPNGRKHKDWWVWVLAGLFIAIGIALSVIFTILLIKSYEKENVLAAYSGAIVAGFALSLAGLTQVLVFIHRKQDEKSNRYNKIEHDYTNFFIKNYSFNEMIYMVLSDINRDLYISVNYNEENKEVTINFDHTIPNISLLRTKYLSLLVQNIFNHKLILGMLDKKYNFISKSKTNGDVVTNAYSAFDTEIKVSAFCVQKMLQSMYMGKYETKYFNFNVKGRLKRLADAIIPYYLIIVHDNKNYYHAATAIDQVPFMLYYLFKENKNNVK